MTKPRFKPLSFLMNRIIDLVLIGLGVLLYYQFRVKAIFPITLNPVVADLVGGQANAVYLISGLFVLVGAFSLLRSLVRLPRQIRGR